MVYGIPFARSLCLCGLLGPYRGVGIRHAPNVLVATLRFDNVLDWSLDGVRKGKAGYAYCTAHHKCCRLGNVAQSSTITTVEAAGPTCEPFSVAGKRKKACYRAQQTTHPATLLTGERCPVREPQGMVGAQATLPRGLTACPILRDIRRYNSLMLNV